MNSSANGVFLPKDKGYPYTVIDGYTMTTHNGGHSEAYYDYVLKQIEPYANNSEALVTALGRIRQELMDGKLHIGNIIK